MRAPNPERALASLEELIASGHEPDGALLDPLLRVLGSSQALATTLFTVADAGLDWFRKSLEIERVSASEHVSELGGEAPDPRSEDLPALLRRHKRRHVLRIGARDVLRLATVEETMREISALAEGSTEVALRHALARAAEEYGEFDPSHPLRFTVLAMGKLGGGELNFSSDVDLVYLFDGGTSGSTGGRRGSVSAQAWAARVAEIVTRALGERTADGLVFRVDLRLRPDGQNGPIVNSLPAAILYYEAWGKTWERAAMLKARPIAGDLALGEAFLAEMIPFVYRRYLDFATLEEIQDMKARIAREHSRARLERDVKLGPGGIRDVEFIVQVLQLIHAGRDVRLRVRPTLEALRAIASAGIIDENEAEALAGAYRFLRDVEHKIQILHERQTQLLPADAEEERLLARRLGLHLDVAEGTRESEADLPAETARFRSALARYRGAVTRSFEKLFFEARERSGADEQTTALLQRLDDPVEARERLGQMGFGDPERALQNLRQLRDGSTSAPASPRRRRALLELAPILFSEVRRSTDPDLVLQSMGEFVSAVGARTSFLALLKENPATLRLLTGLFGSSRYLSNFFLRHPELLDSLVRADLAMVRKDLRVLERELASAVDTATDYESELDALRRFRNEEFLRIGVNDIQGVLDVFEVAEQLSDLAEACLRAALGIATRALAERVGPFAGRFAVVGMGKLGGRELNYNSDLDLVFIYDGPAVAGLSLHERFTKLAQRLMAVLQVTTREGYAYKIDMRLRPSGSAGPLVSSLESYRRYHETSSALWERQALIRARGVAGDESLVAEVESVNRQFVYGRGLGAHDVAEIARLRTRMEQELAGESDRRWNLKTGRGGIVDIEFLVQMLQLRHGQDHPAVRSRRTIEALDALRDAALIDEEPYRVLHDGYRFLRRLENSLRIERDQPVEALEHAGAASVARRLGYRGDPESAGAELLRDFERVREGVRRVYEQHFSGSAFVDRGVSDR